MSNTRILIVEDESLISSHLRIHLTGLGYEIVDIVTRGEDAITCVREQTPDLIIMDIVLAGEMDGISAAKEISRFSSIPVIYATSYSDEEFFDRAKETGPFGYLIKPVKERELELTIRIALHHSELENRLIKSEQHLSDAQRIGLLGSWDWDIEHNTLEWSDQMFRIFGQEPQSFGANYQSFMDRVHLDDREYVQMAVDSALAGEKHYCISYRVVKMNGEINRIQAEGEVTINEQGEAVRMVGTAHDISTILQIQDELWVLAHHDELTGLPNRHLLYDRIGQSIFKAKRDKNQVAIMLIDLDKFKSINDQFGHDVGDDYLKQVSARIRSALREEDTLARLGGDEFVAVINNISSEKDAGVIAQNLLDAIKQPLAVDDSVHTPTASIGVALYPGHGKDSHALLKSADIAMYDSKHQGNDSFSMFIKQKAS